MIRHKLRCKRGHDLNEENVYVIKEKTRERRVCKTCKKMRERMYWLEKKIPELTKEIYDLTQELKKEWNTYINHEVNLRDTYRNELRAELKQLTKVFTLDR